MRQQKPFASSLLTGAKLAASNKGIILRKSREKVGALPLWKTTWHFGKLNLLDVSEKSYSVIKVSLTSTRDFLLSIHHPQPLIVFVFNLGERVPVGEANSVDRDGQVMLYSPGGERLINVGRSKLLNLVIMCFAPEYLGQRDLANHFPDFFEQVRQGHAAILHAQQLITPHLADLLEKFFAPFRYSMDAMYREAKVLEILHYAVKGQNTPTHAHISKVEKQVLQRIRQYLISNLSKRIPVADIATRFKISPGKLNNIFRHLNGVGVAEFISMERMRVARKLIEETTAPMNQIAQATGFRSVTAFTHSFERYHGVSPVRLRTPSLTAVMLRP